MFVQKFGALTERQIEDIEAKLGVTLPADYRAFLKKKGGGTVRQDGNNKILIPSLGKTIAVESFFGYGCAKNSDIMYWNSEYRDEIFENAILIGFDIHQGVLFLKIEDGRAEVCYWDDSYYFEESDDEQNVYFIDDDFSVFNIQTQE